MPTCPYEPRYEKNQSTGRHKVGCIATEDRSRLGISDFGSRGVVAKTKALMSCVVTPQLFCTFVFA